MSLPLKQRRELLPWCGQGLAIAPFASLFSCGKSRSFLTTTANPYQGTDEQLLDEIEHSGF